MITKEKLLELWQVTSTEKLDLSDEIERRISFIMEQVVASGRKTLVLGVSGGVDSTLAALLAQQAARRLRQNDYEVEFIAVRLPYGSQQDEDDARIALDYISPDKIITVNIKGAVDSMHNLVVNRLPYNHLPVANADFEKGNVKARIRMSVQYEIAGLTGGLVVGTENNAEAITGFFTKWGDGACDINPLTGLNKRQVRILTNCLGLPKSLTEKVATADLEDNKVMLSDEEALGLSYNVIDDFLEGIEIGKNDERKILELYEKSMHKRTPIPTPSTLS